MSLGLSMVNELRCQSLHRWRSVRPATLVAGGDGDLRGYVVVLERQVIGFCGDDVGRLAGRKTLQLREVVLGQEESARYPVVEASLRHGLIMDVELPRRHDYPTESRQGVRGRHTTIGPGPMVVCSSRN